MKEAIKYLVRPNWVTLFAGLERKFLTVEWCEQLAYEVYYNNDYDEELVSLTVEKDDGESFKKILKDIATKYSLTTRLSFEQLYEIAIKQWEIAYVRMGLNDARFDDEGKLNSIDLHWHKFDYVYAWLKFNVLSNLHNPISVHELVQIAADYATNEESTIIRVLEGK